MLLFCRLSLLLYQVICYKKGYLRGRNLSFYQRLPLVSVISPNIRQVPFNLRLFWNSLWYFLNLTFWIRLNILPSNSSSSLIGEGDFVVRNPKVS